MADGLQNQQSDSASQEQGGRPKKIGFSRISLAIVPGTCFTTRDKEEELAIFQTHENGFKGDK